MSGRCILRAVASRKAGAIVGGEPDKCLAPLPFKNRPRHEDYGQEEEHRRKRDDDVYARRRRVRPIDVKAEERGSSRTRYGREPYPVNEAKNSTNRWRYDGQPPFYEQCDHERRVDLGNEPSQFTGYMHAKW